MPPDTNPNATQNSGISQIVTVNQNGVIALNAILQAIKNIFPSGTGVSNTANTGSATLPANPVGFVNITLPDGSQAKVPYYAP
jgi:hypothetical protein